SRTDGRGAFTLSVGHPDTTAIYVVSSWYDGIAYFSEPVTVSRPRTSLRPLLVYDPTSTGPGVRLERRLLTVAKQKRDGARDVLELLELKNPGRSTRIAADTLQPTWTGAIPVEAIQFQVAQGDLSPQAVTQRCDPGPRFGPVPPRHTKQPIYAHCLPCSSPLSAAPSAHPT